MLCYVDIEHEVVLDDPMRRETHLTMRMREKLRFEALSGRPCLLLRYTFVSQDWIERLSPAAVLVSGAQTDWSIYDRDAFDALVAFIRNYRGPMIGFCGGHQVIAHAFGAPTGPMRALRPGESDPRPDYGPGLHKELGVHDVTIVEHDRLFEGLPDPLQMEQDHYWAVTELPDELVWLARTDACPIQAFRHRRYPIYGTQFHPERYSEEHPQGRRLLENFFKIASNVMRQTSP